MKFFQGIGLCAVLAAACVAVLPTPVAHAQGQRDALFAQLLRDPANVDLMLRYARAAIADRDYEAAVATLERLVDIDPAAQEARYELALAYFALGSNEVARYHLEIYRERAELTTAEEAQVAAYLDSTASRTRPLSLSGLVEAGVVHRTADDLTGASYDLGLQVDIQFPSADLLVWETEVRLRGISFPDSSEDDLSAFQIRTGPTISIDGTTFGARLKPYVETQLVEADDDDDAGQSLSIGLDYSDLLASGVSIEAGIEYGRIDRDGTGIDSRFLSATAGAAFEPARNLSVGVSLRHIDEDFEAGEADRRRTGIRLGVQRTFDEAFLGLENWSLSGYTSYARETRDGGRDDDIVGYGVAARAFFRSNSYVRTSINGFDRSSSEPGLGDSDTILAVEVGMEF